MNRLGKEQQNVSYAVHKTNPMSRSSVHGITEAKRESIPTSPYAHEEKGGPEKLKDSAIIT